MRNLLAVLSIAVVAACGRLGYDQTSDALTEPTIVATETVRASDAGRVAWSPVDPDTISYDAKNPARTSCADGLCFDVYLRGPDGEQCVTCSNPAFATRPNRGQPAFHPSGEWLVIQAEQAGSDGAVVTRPGRGVRNELWLISLDGCLAYPLRYDGDDQRQGVLHPHFSHDGRILVWAEKYDKAGFGDCTVVGCWRVRIADFSFDSNGVPHLAVRPPVQPFGETWYETHELTVDDSEVLVSSAGSEGVLSSDIYALGIATGTVRRLTTTDYNEHAHPSPDGRWITWMSSAGVPGSGADLWIMTTAGDQKARLTWLNDNNALTKGVNVADHEWAPTGDRIVQYVGINNDVGSIVIFTLR